jgi:phosphatidylinositol alpha-1,6-mannosyltransferase
VEYIYNIVSNLPPNSVVVHTGNAYPDQAQAFDQAFPQCILRDHFILHVLEAYKASKLAKLREYLWWPLAGFWLIIREHPQAIHIGEYNLAGIAAWLAHRLLGIPYLFYTYAEEIPIVSKRPFHKFIFSTVVREADAVVTVSEYTRDLLVEWGVAPDRIFKILPAVGYAKRLGVTPEQIETTRRKYRLENRRVLLTVGTLSERKGHTTVIKALPQISRLQPDVCYVIVGSGPQETALKQQVREAALGDRVVFAGRVDDAELACLYEICDVFVMPHRQIPTTLDTEGCPTVFLEASAHGKPVVGGNAGGVADAILNERTGFIIDGTDQAALANVICRLLSDPGLAQRMGECGREYTSTLNPEQNAAEVWQISKLISGQKKGRS